MNIRKMVTERGGLTGALACLILMSATGCHTVRETEPPRTATEELLISTAADRALVGVDLSWVRGKRVFVDDKYFESYDKGQAVSLIRQCLASAGGLLTATNDKAELIVEVRSGALSINASETLFGIPAFAAPLPLAGTVQTPEIAFYKSQKNDSVSKLALFAYRRESGDFVEQKGPLTGAAYFHMYHLFGLSWQRTDVPELQSISHRPARKSAAAAP